VVDIDLPAVFPKKDVNKLHVFQARCINGMTTTSASHMQAYMYINNYA